MVSLPKDFVATRYPGYFFNVKDELLYSIKIDGVLKPLPLRMPNRFNRLHLYAPEGAFFISVQGYRKVYPLAKLRALSANVARQELIPVKE